MEHQGRDDAQDSRTMMTEQVGAHDQGSQYPTIRLWSDMQRFYVDAELLTDARQFRWQVRIPAAASICQANGSEVCGASREQLRRLVFGRNMIAAPPTEDGLPRYVWLQFLALDRSDPAQETYMLERSVRN